MSSRYFFKWQLTKSLWKKSLVLGSDPPEPEPDRSEPEPTVQFKFGRLLEPDFRSGSRFTKIGKEPDWTELRHPYRELIRSWLVVQLSCECLECCRGGLSQFRRTQICGCFRSDLIPFVCITCLFLRSGVIHFFTSFQAYHLSISCDVFSPYLYFLLVVPFL